MINDRITDGRDWQDGINIFRLRMLEEILTVKNYLVGAIRYIFEEYEGGVAVSIKKQPHPAYGVLDLS